MMGMPADAGPHTACRVPTVREVMVSIRDHHRDQAARIDDFMRQMPGSVLDSPNEWLQGVVRRGLRGE